MGEVPATVTPLSSAETAPAFLSAWANVFGGKPSITEAEWLLAFLWNENAKGKAIVQHNWGNLSSSGQSGDFWRAPWFDRAKVEAMDEPRRTLYLNIHERMLRGEEPSAFRAFPDHATGARTWLQRLRDRFPSILRAAKADSAVAMQDAIFDSGYCASPKCETNAASYANLRNEVHAQGLFRGLGPPRKVRRRGSALVAALYLAGIGGAVLWRIRAASKTR